ncbi:MAG TPA: DUF4007 family protein [Longimicrobium sp.]|jgi:hypothetical protein
MSDSIKIDPAVGRPRSSTGAAPAGPAFARHDTFAPRYGWIKKGFDLARREPDLFTRADAPVVLGVGKNMVRAIRYWCHAFGVLETAIDEAGHTVARPTDFGLSLLADDGGYDPFLEDPASLWLLHWRLVNRPDLATAWYYTFFLFGRTEFTVPALQEALEGYVARTFPEARYARSSYEKDASCLARMYAFQETGGRPSEETFQSPFTELGLLRRTLHGGYAFSIGPKLSLPDAVIASACLEFAASVSEARTIALSRLVYEPGSPGMAFKLTESAVYAALEAVAARSVGISLSEAAGVVQLAYEADPLQLAEQLREKHYARRLGRPGRQEAA